MKRIEFVFIWVVGGGGDKGRRIFSFCRLLKRKKKTREKERETRLFVYLLEII
jgi:hypothetical protein